MSKTRIAVAGAAGRMGQAVLEASAKGPFTVVAALTVHNDPRAGSSFRVGEVEYPLVTTLDGTCDALIDFTVAGGTMAWLDICVRHGIPVIIGATGFDDEELQRIKTAAQKIAVVYAPNCSVGVAAVRRALAIVAADLGNAFDVEIVESHHRHKIDAPSGTAMALAQDVAEATQRNLEDHVVYGRHGQLGERPAGQIGVHALRMGDLMSHHEIHFSGPGETVTIKHTAHSRETFAMGALRAAAWAKDRDAGFYGMADVLEA